MCYISHQRGRILVGMDITQITKYKHACFVVTKDDRSIVVDPGVWSDDFVAPKNVDAVVITHEHPDHCDTKTLADIVKTNPEAVIYTSASVATQLSDFSTQTVSVNETVHIGDFALTFYGGQHALIDSSLPVIENLGVMIDEKLYYPGDSFALPYGAVDLLALPVSAPWMKFSEAAEFLRVVKPSRVFPTHDVILSDVGKELVDTMFGRVADEIGARYERL